MMESYKFRMMAKIGPIFTLLMRLISFSNINNWMRKILGMFNYFNTLDFIVLISLMVVKYQISKCMVLYIIKSQKKTKVLLLVM